MADCSFPTIFAAFELIFSSDVTPVELMPCCLLCFKSLEHLLWASPSAGTLTYYNPPVIICLAATIITLQQSCNLCRKYQLYKLQLTHDIHSMIKLSTQTVVTWSISKTLHSISSHFLPSTLCILDCLLCDIPRFLPSSGCLPVSFAKIYDILHRPPWNDSSITFTLQSGGATSDVQRKLTTETTMKIQRQRLCVWGSCCLAFSFSKVSTASCRSSEPPTAFMV